MASGCLGEVARKPPIFSHGAENFSPFAAVISWFPVPVSSRDFDNASPQAPPSSRPEKRKVSPCRARFPKWEEQARLERHHVMVASRRRSQAVEVVGPLKHFTVDHADEKLKRAGARDICEIVARHAVEYHTCASLARERVAISLSARTECSGSCERELRFNCPGFTPKGTSGAQILRRPASRDPPGSASDPVSSCRAVGR